MRAGVGPDWSHLVHLAHGEYGIYTPEMMLKPNACRRFIDLVDESDTFIHFVGMSTVYSHLLFKGTSPPIFFLSM